VPSRDCANPSAAASLDASPDLVEFVNSGREFKEPPNTISCRCSTAEKSQQLAVEVIPLLAALSYYQ